MGKYRELHELVMILDNTLSNWGNTLGIPPCSFCSFYQMDCDNCRFGKVFDKCNYWTSRSYWGKMKLLCNGIEVKINKSILQYRRREV